MKSYSVLALLVCIVCSGCGKGSGKNSSNLQTRQEQQQDLNGNYKAFLRPINTTVSGFIPYGAVELEVKAQELKIKSYLDDDSNVTHFQALFNGKECPTSKSDTNGDGLLDIKEITAQSGRPLLPMDNDISSQDNGKDVYPRGSSFTYMKSAKLEDVLSDLNLDDANESDEIVKLKKGQPFNLEGKIAIIFGTADMARVPTTVQPFHELPRNLSIPIACGVVKKLK